MAKMANWRFASLQQFLVTTAGMPLSHLASQNLHGGGVVFWWAAGWPWILALGFLDVPSSGNRVGFPFSGRAQDRLGRLRAGRGPLYLKQLLLKHGGRYQEQRAPDHQNQTGVSWGNVGTNANNFNDIQPLEQLEADWSKTGRVGVGRGRVREVFEAPEPTPTISQVL